MMLAVFSGLMITSAVAELVPAPLFQDGMVLQRDKVLPV